MDAVPMLFGMCLKTTVHFPFKQTVSKLSENQELLLYMHFLKQYGKHPWKDASIQGKKCDSAL